MNLVTAAMRRPITVVVAIIAIMLGAWQALQQMPRDILPSLGIPTIYVAQPYGGMDPAQMEGFLTYYYEYHFLYINGIHFVESRNIQGVGLLKLQFHAGTNMAQAMAETIGYVNRSRAFMPPGTVPPFVMRFDAGSVPIGNLVFYTDNPNRTVGEMQDLALNRVRPLFATLPGVSAPPPFGGNQRAIVVKVDPHKLRGYNMSPDEVVAALSKANTIAPSGNVRIGEMIPMVPTNATVRDIKELREVPIREGSNPTVFVRDIGTVEDGTDIPTGYALVNGKRTVYIPVTKRADASTLSVVKLVNESMPKFEAVLPEDVKVSYQFDQSPYVTRAIEGLRLEGMLGALLTGLTVLLFLRHARSALIVVVNIPLSLMASIIGLWLSGQTINLMTLGGLALAVGILVDEATVTIENIHTHLARGSSPARAALDATTETTVPRLLAMLCILAVFIPSFFMVGAGRALFVPLSLAVGFAMVASYLLSSTFVPVLATWIHLLPHLVHALDVLKRRRLRAESDSHPVAEESPPGPQDRSASSERESPSSKPRRLSFEAFRNRYAGALQSLVRARGIVVAAYLVTTAIIIWQIGGSVGKEIFPNVDAGQFQLRLRAKTGTRIERTEQLALKVLDTIKTEVQGDVDITLGFVGVQPASYPVNTIHLWTGGPEEAVLQVQLKHGTRVRIEDLKETLRKKLPEELPGVRFSFEPSDIVSRVMSFGSPTPILVACSGPNLAASREHLERIRGEMMRIHALRDVQFGQPQDYPTVSVAVDRERAGYLGVTTTDVARSIVTATSSSRFVVPNYWADPRSGIAYQIQVQVPTETMDSIEQVQNVPVKRGDPDAAHRQDAARGSEVLLRNVAQVSQGTTVGEYDRYNNQRMVTLTANVHGEDLGRVAAQVRQAVQRAGTPPRGVAVAVRGQIPPMEEMFHGLQSGLLLAIVVIFLMLAANFQSLKLSFIVVSTVPAVIAGVALALLFTGTTLNVQSFMGAIMAIGVAVANAILLVTFAERARMAGIKAHEAAIEGARSRLRPILMTSFAMIAGMTPMALALGEGGEQTAPLGRAVIGGLAAATLATLTVLPAVFAMVQAGSGVRSVSLDPDVEDSTL